MGAKSITIVRAVSITIVRAVTAEGAVNSRLFGSVLDRLKLSELLIESR
jgi:hypothetical protein